MTVDHDRGVIIVPRSARGNATTFPLASRTHRPQFLTTHVDEGSYGFMVLVFVDEDSYGFMFLVFVDEGSYGFMFLVLRRQVGTNHRS